MGFLRKRSNATVRSAGSTESLLYREHRDSISYAISSALESRSWPRITLRAGSGMSESGGSDSDGSLTDDDEGYTSFPEYEDKDEDTYGCRCVVM